MRVANLASVCLVATLAALCVRGSTASMSEAQQAAWNIAEEYANYQFAGQFTTMCSETMTSNPTFELDWNPAYVPWGGFWQGDTGETGCPALFTGFAETWSTYANWAIVTHMELHAVNEDATEVYGTLTLNSQSKATGNSATNLTIAHTLNIEGASGGSPLVSGLELHGDSAAMAQTLCAANTMQCAGFGANAARDATRAPAEAIDVAQLTPPRLGSVGGLTLSAHDQATLDSTAKHNLAMLLTSKRARELDSGAAANLKNLQTYWASIFAGNFTAAETTLSDTVTLVWHGQFDWVPVAGTFIGKPGWASFFAAASANTRNFTFTEFTYDGCNGNTCVMTWDEHSITKGPERVIDGLRNWVVYYFNNENLIQHIDVLVDSMSYATAFCDGFVVCDSSSS